MLAAHFAVLTASVPVAPSCALVTCMYNGLSGTAFGGRLNRDSLYRESLAIIAASGIRIYCFIPAADRRGHERFFITRPNEIVWMTSELSDHPDSPAIQRIKREHPTAFSGVEWQQRCVEIMWGKSAMLLHVAETYPEHDTLYWVDAGLASQDLLSPRYVRAEVEETTSPGRTAFPPDLGERLERFGDGRLVAMTCANPHNHGIPEKYNARPYENPHAVIGGLFGGPRDLVLAMVQAFDQKTRAILADRTLYFEESILTGILADHPSWFTTFTFESWHHEGWEDHDPNLVNFCHFFDQLLPDEAVAPVRTDPGQTRAVVLACVNVGSGRVDRSVLSSLLDGADWHRVLEMAERERVTSWLHRALKADVRVPISVRRGLREVYRETAGRVAQLRSALSEAIAALAAARIPVLLLKGAALQQDVWTDIGLRPWSDLDLFVDRRHVQSAVATLARLGYRPGRAETTLGATVAHENELALVGRGGVVVDLHWSLFDSPHHDALADLSLLCARARPCAVLGMPAKMLSPEEQLLHLCGHLVLHHNGDELLWLNDIAQLTRVHHDTLRWDVVVAEARRRDLVLPLQRCVSAVAATMAADVPPGVLERVKALRPSETEVRVVGRVGDRQRSMAARLWLDVTTMTGWGNRLAYLGTRLFPSPAYMKARYQLSHPAQVALAYPYRWLIGLRRDPLGVGGHTRERSGQTAANGRIQTGDARRRVAPVPSASGPGDLHEPDGVARVGVVRRADDRRDHSHADRGLSGGPVHPRSRGAGRDQPIERAGSGAAGLSASRLVGLGNAACLLRSRGTTAAEVVQFFAGEMPTVGEAEANGPVPVFDLVEVTRDTVRLARDGVTLSGGDTFGGMVAHLGAEVAMTLAGQISNGPTFHAAAVAWQGRAVMIPGASGAGKTTLTAHLVLEGLQYLSDELCVVPDGASDVVGFARPLGVKPGAWPTFEATLRQTRDAEVVPTNNGLLVRSTRLNAIGAGGPSLLCAIIVPRRRPGHGATLQPLSKGEASLALLATLVNARNLPDHGLAAVTRLARRIPAYAAEYDDAAALVPLIRQVLTSAGESEFPTFLGGIVETPVVPDR